MPECNVNNDTSKLRYEIKCVSSCYRNCKRVVDEADDGNIVVNKQLLKQYRTIVRHVNVVIDYLSEADKFIIRKRSCRRLKPVNGTWNTSLHLLIIDVV